MDVLKLPRIAIIGSGPTGISLSNSLVSKGFEVHLFEAGGDNSEGKELTRDHYNFLTSSLMPEGVHRLGGGSNYWIGRIGEYLPMDFEPLSNVRPQSFPVGYEELKPFYLKAFEMLSENKIGDLELVESECKRLGINVPTNLDLRIIRHSNKNFFRMSVKKLQQNTLFTLNLYHKCVEIRKNTTGINNESYDLDFQVHGQILTKNFDLVILCCGALQSPTLLLKSPQIQFESNKHLIGTHLMEHFDGFVGEIYWDRKSHSDTLAKLVLNRNRETKKSLGLGLGIKVSEALRKEKSLINLHLEVVPKQRFYYFDPRKKHKFPIIRQVLYFIERIVKKITSSVENAFLKMRGKSVYSAWVKSEILPNIDSKIFLSDDKSKTVYNHIVSSAAKFEFIRALEVLRQEFSAGKIGDLKIKRSILLGLDSLLEGNNWHPMGTLRMGLSIDQSICDSNLKLIGTDQIYIADSSVFPCGSNSNPTFTAISLGLRLSDHLSIRYGLISE